MDKTITATEIINTLAKEHEIERGSIRLAFEIHEKVNDNHCSFYGFIMPAEASLISDFPTLKGAYVSNDMLTTFNLDENYEGQWIRDNIK